MSTKLWISAAGLVLALAACGRPAGPTGEDFQKVPADLVMTDMVSYMTNNGIRKARLQGDSARVFNDSNVVKVKTVDLVFFDENGVESGRLTSQTGDFNQVTQAMIARGNVILVTKVGNRRIETEELHYDPQTHQLWSDQKTLMVEGGSQMRGTGFTADDKFVNVSVKNAQGRGTGLKIQF